jgi:hypothetical protein
MPFGIASIGEGSHLLALQKDLARGRLAQAEQGFGNLGAPAPTRP